MAEEAKEKNAKARAHLEPSFSSKIIGDFSLDGERRFCHDRRNIARISIDWHEEQEKRVYYDLNLAMDKVRRKDMTSYCNEKLSIILAWILKNKSCLSPPPDFVTVRYVMRKLLMTCCEPQNLVLHAGKFRGTIYVCPWISSEEANEEANYSEQDLKMSSWGYKFEQFMTEGSDPKTGNNENESYCCVIRADVSNKSIIYGSEVDGVDNTMYTGDRLPRQKELIELKTQRMKPNVRKQRLNNYKLRDTWCQCMLVGIPRAVVGFRNDYGVVQLLRSFRVEDFPELSRGFFTPEQMIGYVDDFLVWLKSTVTEDDPTVVYKITFEGIKYKSRRLNLAKETQSGILPPDYVDAIRKQ